MREKKDVSAILSILLILSMLSVPISLSHIVAASQSSSVKIIDSKGKPLANAEIQVYTDAEKYVSTVYSDSTGTATFSMADGTYDFSVLAKLYGYVRQKITVPTANGVIKVPSFAEADQILKQNGNPVSTTIQNKETKCNAPSGQCDSTVSSCICANNGNPVKVSPDNSNVQPDMSTWCTCCVLCHLDYTDYSDWVWCKVGEVHSFPCMTMTYSDWYADGNTNQWSFQWDIKGSTDAGVSWSTTGSVTESTTFTSSTGHSLTLSNGDDQSIYQLFKFKHERWNCNNIFSSYKTDEVTVYDYSPSSFDHRADNPPGDQNPNFWNTGYIPATQITYDGAHETWLENTVSKTFSTSASVSVGGFTVSDTDSETLSKDIKYDMNFQAGHIWDLYTYGLFIVYGYYHNDAGTGRDAGYRDGKGSFNDATSIGTGYWTTCYLGGWDLEDWYKIYVNKGQHIYTDITPYSVVDFDLQLYDGSDTLKAGSYKGPGITDSISFVADSSGWWRIRAYVYGGVGEYSFHLSITDILTISASSGGSTNPAPGTYTYNGGDTVTVTATPSSGYYFSSWSLDGTAYYSNPITVTMNTDHSLTAYFHLNPKLTISTTSGGTTSPAPGTYTYNYGSVATVTATAWSGYYFAYWSLDGGTYYSNPIAVTMTTDHSLTAYFGYNGGGGGGCPILYTYDGRYYRWEGLLNIHNPDSIDVTTNHTLTTCPGRVNGAYEFTLIEHPETVSHIDQVKLFAVLQNGKTVNLPLIWAQHSEYGNVLSQLLYDDGVRVEELGANWNNGESQSIQLKFKALPANIKAQAFIFQINGYNWIVKT